MTKQIDELIDDLIAASRMGCSAKKVQEKRAALEAALKPGEPCAEIVQAVIHPNAKNLVFTHAGLKLPVGTNLYTAAPPAQTPDPMRAHVEQFAAKGGWTKDSGEGAFEFVQRISYAQGVEDGRNRPAQTPVEKS
jgi:hypothetical protein